tara:strand:- start:734 stop:1531 length:798 start_codon:yes stop_codon:yes gene_type:complete
MFHRNIGGGVSRIINTYYKHDHTILGVVNSSLYSTYSILENITRNTKTKDIYIPKTKNQERYLRQLQNPKYKLVIGCGTSGVGKTCLATYAAIDALNNQIVNKIIITRPPIIIDNNYSDSLEDVFEMSSKPILDVFSECYSETEIKRMITKNIIEYIPIERMNGRTFNNVYIIADEMQSSTPKQLLILLTRMGENSKIAVNGNNLHVMQDNTDINGLDDLLNRLNMNHGYHIEESVDEGISIVYFDHDDIQRSKLVKSILSLYKI